MLELDEGRLVALVQEEGFTRHTRIPIDPRPAAHAWTMPGSFATRLEIHCDNPLFVDGQRLAGNGF